MYRIRFHGRGGQGMKTASRILGSAFFLEGYEVQDAPRYGAERRGAPIFAYVRASRKAINERGIIRHPDLVAVADDSLVAIPAAGVLQGLGSHTAMLINSYVAPKTWQHRLNLAGPVLILPAAEDIEECAELPFAGTACAGAAARLVGVISRDALAGAIRTEFGSLGSQVVDENTKTALRAYDLMEPHAGSVTEGKAISASDYVRPDWVEMTAEAVDRAAPCIHAAATSVEVKTGLWRTLRPVIDYDRCNRCWWVCSTFCPDSAITVDAQDRPVIDYDHCKGCMICVAKCPPQAIETIPEHVAQAAEETTS
ncbi:MAG: 2-oxoacid:acceptor oxidoreductase family protein [Pseudomonadota bacterium]